MSNHLRYLSPLGCVILLGCASPENPVSEGRADADGSKDSEAPLVDGADAAASPSVDDASAPLQCDWKLERKVCSEACSVVEKTVVVCPTDRGCPTAIGCLIEIASGDTYFSPCLIQFQESASFRICNEEEGRALLAAIAEE